MAQVANVAWCSVFALLVCGVIGLPIAIRAVPRQIAGYLAPAIGWAVYSVLAFPVLSAVGMRFQATISVTAVGLAVALAVLWNQRSESAWPSKSVLLALMGAALLAVAPMAAVLPKVTPEGVTLAAPIFDHSKIALIDEMIRSGVPATNPFFSEMGTPDRVAYYYLWHFSAAAMAVMTYVNGWEADAALTWFTAFASLLLMIGIAIWISGRTSSAIIVLGLAATSSLRVALSWLLSDSAVLAAIGYGSGFGGWLFQTSWAPHHMASAMCVVLACVTVPRISGCHGPALPCLVGLLAAAGFQSSTWVGGVTFVPAALAIGVHCFWKLNSERRTSFVGYTALAGAVAIALSAPFIYDQLVMAALRGGGLPVTLKPLEFFGDGIPSWARPVLEMPAYWLVYLPAELPGIYPSGLLALLYLQRRTNVAPPSLPLGPIALLITTALVVAWLLASTVGNNDLGWRAVLPAVLLLTAVAAGVAVHCDTLGARAVIAAVALGFLLGLPEGYGIARQNFVGRPAASEREFAATPALWSAVRQHSTATERIANNPGFLADMTQWPINISWALLANRRSCYAGNDLALPFAPVSSERRAAIESQFTRIFSGEPARGDIEQLAMKYGCDVVVVTPLDGAYAQNPFEVDRTYRLVASQPGAWRIYRRSSGGPP